MEKKLLADVHYIIIGEKNEKNKRNLLTVALSKLLNFVIYGFVAVKYPFLILARDSDTVHKPKQTNAESMVNKHRVMEVRKRPKKKPFLILIVTTEKRYGSSYQSL